MALDKLVDSSELDSGLTSIANAIRTKGGTSASLSFPSGFVDAISAIPTGGGGITVVDTTDEHGGTIREITAVDLSGDTVTAAHLESGYTAHDATGRAITGLLVPGGNSPVVIGTFTTSVSEAGAVKSVTVNYSGTGHPVSILVYPVEGANDPNGTIGASKDIYGTIFFVAIKNYLTGNNANPIYNSGGEENNKGYTYDRYKNSSTSETTHNGIGNASANLFGNASLSAGPATILCFRSNTQFDIFVRSTSYGFIAGATYTYVIQYSA